MRLLKISHTCVAFLLLAGLFLSACEVNEFSESSIPNLVTGVVSAPSADSLQFSSAVSVTKPIFQLAYWLTGTADAALTGLVPVSGATVQLVRLDNQGNVVSVIASTTSAGNGSYTFNDTPAPDSTLAVRVTGQSATMRAIVTGSVVNVSPASEAVVDSIVDALGGGVSLANFAVEEVFSLAGLAAGLDVDLDGLTFAQAVAAIQSATSPILGNLINGFSGGGVETVLHNALYGGLLFEPRMKDTFTLGAGKGGIEIRTLGGGWGYGDVGAVSGGNIFGTLTRHDLTNVGDAGSDITSVDGQSHVVTTSGQVVVADAAVNFGVGAISADGSLMVYPVETNESGILGRGLMLAVRKAVDTTALSNTVLDAAGGAETAYNLVRLQETLSSPLSSLGENLVALTTENGSMSFDSNTQFVDGENVYAVMSADVTSTNRLALDLDNGSIYQSNPPVQNFSGRYQVIMDGSVIMLKSDGSFLGQGFASTDGKLLVLSTATDLMQIELDVLANDSDPDLGDNLTITGTSLTQLGGTVTVNAAGNKLLYIPPKNTLGTEVFTYAVSDGTTTRTGNVSFVIDNTNSNPTAIDDTSLSVPLGSINNVLNVLVNDSDADIGDTVTIIQIGAASAGGTVTINGTGTALLYSPATGHVGDESFTYTISDAGGLTGTATVIVTTIETGNNTAPTAVNDSGISVGRDSINNQISVLANDSDPDVGDVLTVVAAGDVQAPTAGGSVTANGSNVLYAPAPGYTGTESFSYTISDGVDTATATVTATIVAAGNTPPTAVDDGGVSVAMGSSNNVLNVLANDSDPDLGSVLLLTAVGTPNAGGTVAINGTNDRLIYTPAPGYNGIETFTYTVSDGFATDTATVTVTVVGIGNTAPNAVDDTNLNVQQNSVNNELDVLANDSDPDLGAVLTIIAVGPRSAGGSVVNNGTSLSYAPAPSYTGPESFTYTISDGTDTDTATVSINVVNGNTTPSAVDDPDYLVAENSSNILLNVLANDTDPDVGDALTITAVGPRSNGGSVTNNGTSLSYTPAPGYSGPESFTYTVSDGTSTSTANVTVTVNSANTAPNAADDSGFNVQFNSSNNALNVLANDSDPDLGDTLTITAVGAASAGGSVTNNGTSLSYAPALGYSGPESFTYTISDGVATDTATVTLTVVGTSNTAPNAANDSGLSVQQGSTNNVLNVLANDSDPDVGDTLTITAVGAASAGGSVVNNGTSLSYSPAAAYTGPESFTYTVSDGTSTDTATVSVTVVSGNTAPNAVDDSGYLVAENSGNIVLSVLANDSDPDVGDTLTITAVGARSAGGSVTNNGTSLSYTPAPGYSGPESFTYTVSDGAATDTATVTVTILPANSAPTANDDSGFNVQFNSSNNALNVLANDSDPDVGDTLTITAVGAASAGGSVVNNGTSLSYSPAAAYTGPESFTYTVSDGTATDTATVSVTVSAGINIAPVPADDSFNVGQDTIDNALDVLVNDSDTDLPTQALSITAASITTPLGTGGAVSINGTNNGLLYTPPAGASGIEVISYTVSDGIDTAVASVTVTVGTNAAPNTADDNFSVGRNSVGNALNVLANDSDPDVPAQALAITAVGAASAGGSVTNNGTSLSYTPEPGYSGPESFTYTVSDGAATDTATVSITVTVSANTAPNAVNDSGFNVQFNSSNNALNVLANDSDPDLGDTLTITAVGAASAGGSVTNNGTSLSYAPALGYSGPESFTYTISDGVATDTATVTLTVVGTSNTAPNAANDSGLSVQQGSTNNVLNVLANDSDPDVGDTLTITAVGARSAGGSVTNNGTSLSYSPAAAYTGPETFTYTVSDGTLTDTATVSVTVVSGNTVPNAVNDSYNASRNSTGNALSVLANDSDADVGDTLTITAVGAASAGGSVTNNGTSLSYSPASGYSGPETFTYTVSDGAATDTATVTVTVIAPANTPPTAIDDGGYSVAMDSSNNALNVLANDSDPDLGDTLTITAVGPRSNGGSVTNNGSSLSYTPAPGYNGSETFTYTVSDGAATDTASVTVTVVGIGNTAPIAVNDSGYNVQLNSSNNALNVLANDSDPDLGDTLIITAVGAQSAGGSVTHNGTSVSYSPAASYTGVETFTYTVSDGTDTDTATVSVNVVSGNTAPAPVDDAGFGVAENSINNILDVLANDSDADIPAQTLTVVAAGDVQAPTAGGLVTPNGSNLIYTPAVGYSGTESFSYTVSDGTAIATATVTVMIVGANTAPVPVNDSGLNVRQNSSNNLLNVLANDSDPDVGDSLTISAVGATSNGGTVTNNGTNLSYSPAASYLGPESFTYTVSDGTATATATVSVTVVTGNTTPVAVNDSSFNVGMGTTANPLDVLANDSDADVGDTLTITAVGAASNGGVVVNNGSSLSYTPAAGFSGSESFSYSISDDTATASATVTVTVIAANTPPSAANDTLNVRVDSSNTLDVLANDSDPDVSDTLTITAVGAASAGGTVTNNGDNVSYTPAAGYTGAENFSYTISDGKATATATVTLNITNSNTAPEVADDTTIWHVVMPAGEILETNLANREIGIAIRRGSGLGNGILSGSYNVIQHAGHFTSSGAGGAAEIGYLFGTVAFNGSGGVSSGSLLDKRTSLDIDAAQSGSVSALTTLESSAQAVSGGSYSVSSNGTLTLTLSSPGMSMTGSGAVSSDGEIIALAIRVTEGGIDTGRGLLFLMRQP